MNQLVYTGSTKPSWNSLAAALSCSLSDLSSPPIGDAKTSPLEDQIFIRQRSATIHPSSYIIHPPSSIMYSTSSIGRMHRMMFANICAFRHRAQAVEQAGKIVFPRSQIFTLLTIIQLQLHRLSYPPFNPSYWTPSAHNIYHLWRLYHPLWVVFVPLRHQIKTVRITPVEMWW